MPSHSHPNLGLLKGLKVVTFLPLPAVLPFCALPQGMDMWDEKLGCPSASGMNSQDIAQCQASRPAQLILEKWPHDLRRGLSHPKSVSACWN